MGEPSLGTPPSARAPEDRLDSWKEIAAYLNRDVTTVQRWEKREGMPVHRHLHDRMGSVYASRAELDAWTRSRNLRAAQENGNDAIPPDPPAPPPQPAISTSRPDGELSCCWPQREPCWRSASILWLQRTEYFWRNPIAQRAISDGHGLRWSGAGRRRLTRRSLRCVSVGPGRTDGRLGYAGRLGPIPQLDPRQRAGTRQSIDPHPGVLARRVSGHLLGPQARRPERRRHQHLGGANTGRTNRSHTSKAWRSSTGRATAPGSPTTRPGPEIRCSSPDGTRRIREQPAHLHRARRAPLSLSLVVARRGIHLLRPGLAPGQTGHLAHPFNRRNSRTDHVAQCACELSGPLGSAHADVPRQRSRWLRPVALQHGRRAPHSPPADLGP